MIEKRIVPKTNKFATLIKDPDKFKEKNNLVSNENSRNDVCLINRIHWINSVRPHFPQVCLSLWFAMYVPLPHLEQIFLFLVNLSPSILKYLYTLGL